MCMTPERSLRHYIDCSAIVNDQLSALELAVTPNMGHGWASDVALSNIHERYLFRSLFSFNIRTHK